MKTTPNAAKRPCPHRLRRVMASVVPLTIAAGSLLDSAAAQCEPQTLGAAEFVDHRFDAMTAVGDIVFLATTDYATSDTHLRVTNVANPTAPSVIGQLDLGGTAGDIARQGTTLFIPFVDGDLAFVDVTDLENPALAGSINTPGQAYSVAVCGSLAYVGTSTNSLEVIDISDLDSPQIIGSVDTDASAFYGVHYSCGIVYTAGDNGIRIIDVTYPGDPVIISSISIGRSEAIFLSDKVLYASDRNFGLRVFDVSDPAGPREIGQLELPGTLTEMAVSGDNAFLFGNDNTVHIIDISDPTNPALNVAWEGPSIPYDLFATDRRLGIGSLSNFTMFDTTSCSTGACCIDGLCIEQRTRAECEAVGGTFAEVNTTGVAGLCAGDRCFDAIPITEGDTDFTTTAATTGGPGVPQSCSEGLSPTIANDIWFTYTPTSSGRLTVSTCDQAQFDTLLLAYTGPCPALQIVACNDDAPGCVARTSRMEFPVIEGEPVVIRVGAFGGSPITFGTGTLTLILDSCSPDFNADGITTSEDFFEFLNAYLTPPSGCGF